MVITDRKIRVVAFDLDDTLYDECRYVDACLENVARVCGATFGLPPETILADLRSDSDHFAGLTRGVVGRRLSLERYLEIYRSTSPASLPLRPDAVAFLDYLVEQRPDISRYIITDGRSLGQWAKIHALGLERYFERENILVSGDTGYDKHSSRPFTTVMERSGTDSGLVYIGDNLAKDFIWPRRLGWTTVLLRDTRGVNIHPQLSLNRVASSHRPHITVKSLYSLFK